MAALIPGKLLYIATPHTASRATEAAICGANQPEAVQVRMAHLTASEIREGRGRVYRVSSSTPDVKFEMGRKPQEKILRGGEHIFTVIRNPYDWLATCYLRRNKRWNTDNMLEFLHELTTRNNIYIHEGNLYPHARGVAEILHYEVLQESLNKTLTAQGLKPCKLLVKNVTQGKLPWKSYFDKESYKFIASNFGKEITNYGYNVI